MCLLLYSLRHTRRESLSSKHILNAKYTYIFQLRVKVKCRLYKMTSHMGGCLSFNQK